MLPLCTSYREPKVVSISELTVHAFLPFFSPHLPLYKLGRGSLNNYGGKVGAERGVTILLGANDPRSQGKCACYTQFCDVLTILPFRTATEIVYFPSTRNKEGAQHRKTKWTLCVDIK